LVDCIALDEIIFDKYDSEVSLLKLDIEGGEVSVLLDSAPWIEKIFCIYVELHDRIDSRCTTVFREATSGMHTWSTNSEKACKTRDFASSRE
jgi:hypothetical protein